jgi:hypothetical protein
MADKVYRITFELSDGTEKRVEFTAPQGDAGRGIVSITRTSGTGAAGTIDTYTVTYTDNTTSTFQVCNGADGIGENGATFIPNVDSNGNLSWTNNKGLANPNTVNIKGPTYTLTNTDKTTIANAVKASLPAYIPAVLTSDFYGDTLPQAGTPGRIFFKKVTE